ncbi:hypothetical protein BDR04DRAFT_1158088 [Suillus decipiens]|nr:hypothetical protein BDR04DRAFT_1158088 [Suillus decipiens]
MSRDKLEWKQRVNGIHVWDMRMFRRPTKRNDMTPDNAELREGQSSDEEECELTGHSSSSIMYVLERGHGMKEGSLLQFKVQKSVLKRRALLNRSDDGDYAFGEDRRGRNGIALRESDCIAETLTFWEQSFLFL